MAIGDGPREMRDSAAIVFPDSDTDDLPGSLPVASVLEYIDLTVVAQHAVQQLSALRIHHIAEDAIWRDSFALTGTLRTFYRSKPVTEAWSETYRRQGLTDFALTPKSSRIVRHGAQSCWVQAHFTFRTTSFQPHAPCSGFISLVHNASRKWKIWMLRSVLESLDGHGSVDELAPMPAVTPGTRRHKTDIEPGQEHFDGLVVGAGQAGLSAAGHLQAIGISYVLVDRCPNVGYSWNTRCDSLKLHTVKEYAHLSFGRTFGLDLPEFLTKGDIAKGYQEYVKRSGINLWFSTELFSASWEEEEKL